MIPRRRIKKQRKQNETTNEDDSKSSDSSEKSDEQSNVQAGEKEDEKLEDYSKGVQTRIAKLTRKMREAERQRDAATEYAKTVEAKRQRSRKRFEKADADYIKKSETNISTGLEAAQKELAAAIESGDAKKDKKQMHKQKDSKYYPSEVQTPPTTGLKMLKYSNIHKDLAPARTIMPPNKFAKPSEVQIPQQPVTQSAPNDPSFVLLTLKIT